MRYGNEEGKTSITMKENPLAKQNKSNTKSDALANSDWPKDINGRPDFASMTSDQRLAYHTRRLSL